MFKGCFQTWIDWRRPFGSVRSDLCERDSCTLTNRPSLDHLEEAVWARFCSKPAVICLQWEQNRPSDPALICSAWQQSMVSNLNCSASTELQTDSEQVVESKAVQLWIRTPFSLLKFVIWIRIHLFIAVLSQTFSPTWIIFFLSESRGIKIEVVASFVFIFPFLCSVLLPLWRSPVPVPSSLLLTLAVAPRRIMSLIKTPPAPQGRTEGSTGGGWDKKGP